MKVLIVNDHVVFGGAEVQSLREKQILESKGVEVFYLYFDKESKNTIPFKEKDGFFRIGISYGLVRRILCKLGILQRYFIKKTEIKNLLRRLDPDIIHINVLTKEPIGIYSLLSKYYTVQTLRDYSCVCPKLDCINDKGLCRGAFFSNCHRVCYNTLKGRLAIRLYKQVIDYRKRCVDKFITPSQKLMDFAVANGYKNVTCINNPIDADLFQSCYVVKDEQVFNNKRYLWSGVINMFRFSGLKMLVEVFDKFQVGKNVSLIIAGKIDETLSIEFKHLIEGKDYIQYLGGISNEQMLRVVTSCYVVVNPSLIMDNYPNTVLEAMALGTLVIGSSMGGIPEMLDNRRGFIFDNSSGDLYRYLEESYNLPREKYLRITQCARDYTLNNNSVENYCSKLLSVFAERSDEKF